MHALPSVQPADPLQAVDRGCLAVLVEACSARSPDNDVRALAIQCLAALSMHFDLREPLLAAGVVQALCRAAKLREAMLQVPTAAALANMCSNPAFTSRAADADDTLAALNTLSLSGNRDVQVRPNTRLPPQVLLQGSSLPCLGRAAWKQTTITSIGHP